MHHTDKKKKLNYWHVHIFKHHNINIKLFSLREKKRRKQTVWIIHFKIPSVNSVLEWLPIWKWFILWSGLHHYCTVIYYFLRQSMQFAAMHLSSIMVHSFCLAGTCIVLLHSPDKLVLKRTVRLPLVYSWALGQGPVGWRWLELRPDWNEPSSGADGHAPLLPGLHGEGKKREKLVLNRTLHKNDPIWVNLSLYLVLQCCSWGEAVGVASLCELMRTSPRRKETHHFGGVP